VRICPGTLEYVTENSRILRSGNAVLPVDHVEGHPGSPQTGSGPNVGLDVLRILIAGEDLRHSILLEADRGCDLHQDRVISNVARLDEVRVQQSLFQRALKHRPARLEGEVQKTVCVYRAHTQRLVVAEQQPFLGSDCLDTVNHLFACLRPAAVLATKSCSDRLHRLRRGRRIQLERAPHHLDVLGMVEVGQGLLETTLPDVAPGADDVTPDLDTHTCQNRRPNGFVPSGYVPEMKLNARRSFTTSATPEAVFAFLGDFRNTERWDPGTVQCSLLSSAVGPGATYRNLSKFLGREADLVYTTLVYEQDRQLHFQGTTTSFVGDDRFSFSPDGTGTRVDYHATFEFRGVAALATPLVALYLPVLAKKTIDQLRASLEQL